MRVAGLLVCTIAGSLAACSNGHGGMFGPCAQFEEISPLVQIAYPVPSASSVPRTPALVLYYASNSSGSVPLLLMSSSGSIAGTPAALPAVLPSPIASPSSANPPKLYAATFAQLAANTAYAIRYDQTTISGCAPATTAMVTAASFTTQ